jgi:hypothetical protein
MAEGDKTSILHPKEQPVFDSVEGDHVSMDIEKSSARDDGTGKDPNIVTFDQPFDPENPLDWSSAKKTVAIIMVTIMTILSYVFQSR